MPPGSAGSGLGWGLGLRVDFELDPTLDPTSHSGTSATPTPPGSAGGVGSVGGVPGCVEGRGVRGLGRSHGSTAAATATAQHLEMVSGGAPRAGCRALNPSTLKALEPLKPLKPSNLQHLNPKRFLRSPGGTPRAAAHRNPNPAAAHPVACLERGVEP